MFHVQWTKWWNLHDSFMRIASGKLKIVVQIRFILNHRVFFKVFDIMIDKTVTFVLLYYRIKTLFKTTVTWLHRKEKQLKRVKYKFYYLLLHRAVMVPSCPRSEVINSIRELLPGKTVTPVTFSNVSVPSHVT